MHDMWWKIKIISIKEWKR